jgi:hypothetical protein
MDYWYVACEQKRKATMAAPPTLAHPFLDLSILPLDFSTTLFATLDVISALFSDSFQLSYA